MTEALRDTGHADQLRGVHVSVHVEACGRRPSARGPQALFSVRFDT
jgi:hypothetical protein